MTRWKNEHKKVPKTNLIPMAWELKQSAAAAGSAGFSGGGLVMQNGGGSGDCVSSSTEVPSSTTLTSIRENGLYEQVHTNGTLQYEGNGDDHYSDENEPCSSTAPSSTYTGNGQNHRQALRLTQSFGRSNEAAGSSTPSSFGAAPQQQLTAVDFLKDHSSIQNRGAIPLGPPPPSPVRGGNSSYLKPTETFTTGSSNWNPSLTGGTVVTNGNGPFRPPGDVGLTNLGNTCFMNSGLQCLIHTATLAEYFLKSLPARARAGRESLMREFQLVMQQAWFGTIPTLNVIDFRNKLGEVHSQFKDGRQHDCQEFLALTLDTLHEQLKIKNSGKEGNKDNGQSEPPSAASLSNAPAPVVEPNCSATTNGHGSDGTDEEVPSKRRRQSLNSAAEMAENYWNKHMAENNTVIAKTFQGVHKSTVVCGECKFVSVTYEPFMYLSLPIPRVVSKTINVTFISLKDARTPIRVSVTINLDDHVQRLKELVAQQIPGFSCDPGTLGNCLVVEVVNHNVARRIEDETQIKFLQDENRNVYMYELNDNFSEKYGISTNLTALSGICPTNIFCPQSVNKSSELNATTYLDEDWDTDETPIPPLVVISEGSGTIDTSPALCPDFIGPLPPSSTSDPVVSLEEVSYSNEINAEVSSSMSIDENEGRGEHDSRGSYIPCIICLEDKPAVDLRKHKSCGAAICLECLPRAASYFVKSPENTIGAANGDHLKCPTCCFPVPTTQFVTFWTDPNPQLILTAVLFRRNLDSNNNAVSNPPRYFGAPLLVRIPTTVPSEELHQFLSQINPFPEIPCKLVTVSNDGTRCGQCIFAENCDGCEIPREGDVSLAMNTCIAFSYINITEDQIGTIEPPDMAFHALASLAFSPLTRSEPQIDIHDCLRSFSEVEHLDENNPWNCPQCKKNQSATKTMTICRFPDFLIIYLKRFVFIDHSSIKLNNKLRFPLHDLDMGPYIAPESAGKNQNMYDLYSCVCHFGSAQAGHYTAFGKSPCTDVWHHFNDSTVDERVPHESEFSSAYVLFYQRKGLIYDIPKRTSENILHRPIPSLFHLSSSAPSTSTSLRPVGCATPIVVKPHTSTSWTNGHDTQQQQPDSSQIIEENTLDEMSLTVGQSVGNSPHPSSAGRLSVVEEVLPGGFMQEDGMEPDDGFESDFDSQEKDITPKRKTENLTLYNEAMDESRSVEIDEA